MTHTRIIILDDHPLFSFGLKRIIESETRFVVSDCCLNSRELFFSLSLVSADMAIIDCSRPENDANLVSVINRLNAEHKHMSLVTLGDCPSHKILSHSLAPKVQGYFCKTQGSDHILAGLQHVNRDALLRKESESASILTLSNPESLMCQRLTAKEMTVLEYLHAGLNVSQIALRLNRSVKTISTQKRAAMRKLGLQQEHDIFRLDLNKL
jgi:two-component system capsular synthesis response regulator RcsB